MGNFNKWFHGLRGKLLLSACLPLIAFSITTVVSLRATNRLGDMLSSAYTDVIPNMDSLGQIGMQRARVGYFIWAALHLRDDLKGRNIFVEKVEKGFSEYKKGLDYYESTGFSAEEEKNYAAVRSHKAHFQELTQNIIDGLKKNQLTEDDWILKSMNGGEWHVLATEIQSMIENNMKLYENMASENNKSQIAERKTTTQLLLTISILCSFILFGVLMWIAGRVSKSVGQIAEELTQVGSQVAGAISQLTTAGHTLSESSTESAAALEETVASLEELTSMVKMNSGNASQAATLSQSSRSSAEDGQREIQNLIQSMSEISDSSKKIEEIIGVIDDIAFQTNLLALNAAVEAARAGEQGKGFAVVAEAVRTLAQRSAVAAKDIHSLIKDSVSKVDRGTTIADRSGEVLNSIVNSVKKVSDLNHEISTASSEQTTGIQQISTAMNQLDQGTQANAASSEEIASSSQEISGQAQQMKKLVVLLNKEILGNAFNTNEPDHLPQSSFEVSNRAKRTSRAA